ARLESLVADQDQLLVVVVNRRMAPGRSRIAPPLQGVARDDERARDQTVVATLIVAAYVDEQRARALRTHRLARRGSMGQRRSGLGQELVDRLHGRRRASARRGNNTASPARAAPLSHCSRVVQEGYASARGRSRRLAPAWGGDPCTRCADRPANRAEPWKHAGLCF